MDYMVVDTLPGDAAKGACYLSRSALGEVIVNGERRPERAIITPVNIDFEGQLCIGERAVRHMAHLLGMVDEWRAEAVTETLRQVAEERDRLSAQVARLTRQINELREMDAPEERVVYVALDGSEHATAGAAQSVSERVVRREPEVLRRVQAISAQEAPNPNLEREPV